MKLFFFTIIPYNNMQKTLFFFGFIALFTVSCVNETTNNSFLPKYAQNVNTTHLSGTTSLPRVSKILVNPGQLWMVGDSLIIIDSDNEFAYSLISISGDSLITRFGRLGKSRDELLRPALVQVDSNNHTFIYDDGQKLMHFNRVDSLTNRLDNASPLLFNDVSGGYLNRSSNGYVSDNLYGDGHIFTYYDDRGNPVEKFGLVPTTQVADNVNPDFYMSYQVQFLVSPDKKRLCAMGFYHDWLAFFDISGEHPVLIKEYFSEKPQVQSSGDNDSFHIHSNNSTTIHYWSSTPFMNGLYINYIGAKEADFNNGEYSNYIFKCNWDGDIEKIYVIDDKIGSVVSNDDGSKLYGLAMEFSDTDNKIIEYIF